MRCPACRRENPPGSRFCGYCGMPMPDETGNLRGAALAGEDVQSLANVVRRLTDDVVQLRQRVASLERAQGLDTQTTGAPSPAPPEAVASAAGGPPAAEAHVAPPRETVEATTTGVAAGVQGSVSLPPAREAPPSSGVTPFRAEGPPQAGPPSWSDRIDWEQVLGRNWFAIIGAVALAVGMGFFLKLAFENRWIDERGRVILGLVAGLALLGVAEYAQRRFPVWAQAVAGGGLSILYLAVYATVGFYDLLAPGAAFLFLALIVAVSGVLALRYESLVIALLGTGGAFLTPVLLGSTLPASWILISYILLVDLGILGVSTFRNWRWLTLLGLAGSYALFGLWLDRIPGGQLVLAQVGLTGILLIFVGATTLFHIVWRRAPAPTDLILMTLNAIAYYAYTFGLLWDDYRPWIGLITLGVALFYGIAGWAAIRRPGAPPQIALFSLATALIFVTIAVPVQLSGVWITAAWAAEGLVLLWIGFVLASWRTRAFALGVLAIAGVRLLVLDTPVATESFRLLLNARFPTFAAVIAICYAVAYLYRRESDRLERWESHLGLVFVGAASFLTVWVLSAEVISYFENRAFAAQPGSRAALDAGNATLLALTASWAAYAGALLTVAFGARSRLLRWLGVGLLTATLLKFLLVDSFVMRLDPARFSVALNFPFLVFVVILGVFALAIYLYGSRRGELPPEERLVYPLLIGGAALLGLWGLSAETIRFFDLRRAIVPVGPGRIAALQEQQNGMLLALTALWAVYAAGLLAAALRVRGSHWVLGAGLALASVAAAKHMLVDAILVAHDPNKYVLALNFSFLVSALVMASVALGVYAVHRRAELFDGNGTWAFRSAMVLANFIALWLLSAEILRFVDSREAILVMGMQSARHLSLTLLWAVYAIGVITSGIVFRSPVARQWGMLLMGAPVLKLFVFDVFLLERGYRVAAFVTLGVLLLGMGLAYQRYNRSIKGFFFGRSTT